VAIALCFVAAPLIYMAAEERLGQAIEAVDSLLSNATLLTGFLVSLALIICTKFIGGLSLAERP
jgi:hypothetical protein